MTWKCDLDLWDRGMVLLYDTLYWYAKHLCQVLWKSIQATHSYGLGIKKLDCIDKWMVQFESFMVSFTEHMVLICKRLYRTILKLFHGSFKYYYLQCLKEWMDAYILYDFYNIHLKCKCGFNLWDITWHVILVCQILVPNSFTILQCI